MTETMTIEQAVARSMNRATRRKHGLKTPGPGTISHVHVQVKEVAMGLAQALFEEFMTRNEVFAEFKRQHPELTTSQLEAKFVAHLWPQLIDPARATMAGMLNGPYSDEVKEDIMDALVKDQTLAQGRRNPATLLGTK